jgi:hypothetical protein
MIKKIPVMKEFLVCDFCNRQEGDDVDIRKCELCGRDVCNNCSNMEFIDDDNTLNLCNECSERVDLEEYRKLFEEINKLQQQIQEKYVKAHSILAEMRKSI